MSKQNENEELISLKDNIIFKIILCIVLTSIVIGVYLFLDKKLDVKISRRYTLTEDITLMNEVEDFCLVDGKLVLEGYAFQLNKDSTDSNVISVFLRNTNTDEEVWADISQSERTDINTYYGPEYNYEHSGFQAVVKEKNLNSDECYEVIVKVVYDDIRTDDKGDVTTHEVNKTVSTNRFILDGKLYDYNPFEFDEPDMNVESDLLREVLANGRLCFYQKEAGMYVYQYEGQLYWIARSDFEFNINGDPVTVVPYHLATSQVDKLPEHRIQHAFDNLGLNFEEVEYLEENTSPYRMVVFDIPQEYPITYVTTGHYSTTTEEWIWKKSFHLSDMK